MSTNRFRIFAIVLLVPLAALAGYVAADRLRGQSDPPTYSIGPEGGVIEAEGLRIQLPRGAVQSQAEVSIATDASPATGDFPKLEQRSAPFSIAIDQPLRKPAIIEFDTSGIDQEDRVFVASREDPEEMWLLDSVPVGAGGTVTITTRHFSFWQIVEDVARGASAKLIDLAAESVATFLRFGGVRAAEPHCGSPPPGYEVTGDIGLGDPNALVFACLEGDLREMTLQVVNNRAIGMEVVVPEGLEVSDLDGPQLTDEVVNLWRDLNHDSRQTISATGAIGLSGSPAETQLEIKPTTRTFIVDMAIFTVRKLGGKEGKAIDAASNYLQCPRDAAASLADGPPASAAAAFASAQSIARSCGQTAVDAGAVGFAKELAVFYGGMKLGVGTTDALAAMLTGEEAHLQVVKQGELDRVRPPGGSLTAASIGPAKIGMTKDEVRAVLGSPDRTADRGDNWLWDYPNPGWIPSEDLSGVGLHFERGKLFSYSCTTTACSTDRGLRVGNPASRLERLYGSELLLNPIYASDPDCCGLEMIVSAGGAGAFPALSFSDDGAGTIISIAGGTPEDAPVESEPRDFRYFATPSGNIVCELDRAGVICDIIEFSYEPPPQPPSCRLDWGRELELIGGRPGAFTCAGQGPSVEVNVPWAGWSRPYPDAPAAAELGYGQIAAAGDYRCESSENGVRCMNGDTRHGFFLSRVRQRPSS